MSQAVLTPHAGSPHDEHLHLGRNWWLFLLLGLVSVFVGLVAIGSAFIATLATVTVLGILLLIAGGAEVIHAIAVRNYGASLCICLCGALSSCRAVHARRPGEGRRRAHVVDLGGLFRCRRAANHLFAGRAVPFLGLGASERDRRCLPWRDDHAALAELSLWVIGMFIGIDLVFQGWAWIFLALYGPFDQCPNERGVKHFSKLVKKSQPTGTRLQVGLCREKRPVTYLIPRVAVRAPRVRLRPSDLLLDLDDAKWISAVCVDEYPPSAYSAR